MAVYHLRRKKMNIDAAEYAHFCELAFVETKKIWHLLEAIKASYKKKKFLNASQKLAYKKRMLALARTRSTQKQSNGYWGPALTYKPTMNSQTDVNQELADETNKMMEQFGLPSLNIGVNFIPLFLRFIAEYLCLRLTPSENKSQCPLDRHQQYDGLMKKDIYQPITSQIRMCRIHFCAMSDDKCYAMSQRVLMMSSRFMSRVSQSDRAHLSCSINMLSQHDSAPSLLVSGR